MSAQRNYEIEALTLLTKVNDNIGVEEVKCIIQAAQVYATLHLAEQTKRLADGNDKYCSESLELAKTRANLEAREKALKTQQEIIDYLMQQYVQTK
jgi:hypothetical protein